MKPIFTYVDFREYLLDFYEGRKRESRFSFREFSRLAGFSSPVFIKLVIDGKANLARASITKLCNAMGLEKMERRYFKHLVLFSQSKDLNKKMQHLDELKVITSSLHLNSLADNQIEYFSKWYHPVIKELLSMVEFKGDYDLLASLVEPAISAREAQESVQLLMKLNLVTMEQGRYKVVHKFVTTSGLTIDTLLIRSVQKEMAVLAAHALDRIPVDDRDISGVSVGITAEALPQIREVLARCRRQIFEITSACNTSNRVYRLNLHLFPISKQVPDSQMIITKRQNNV